MRWNEAEIGAFLSSKPPDWEGRLCYKPPRSSGGWNLSLEPVFKERYFKLLGNLLYCLRLGPDTRGQTNDPVMVLVLENFTVTSSRQTAEAAELNTFSITFKGEESGSSLGDKKHVFVADSGRTVTQWTEVEILHQAFSRETFIFYHYQALKNCSYEYKREQLILLQIKLRNKTGVDPLRSTAFQYNPVYFLNNKPPRDPTLLRTPPEPPQRKTKTTKNGSSRFTSHIGIEHWDSCEEDHCDNVKSISATNPSFKSHLKKTCEENLIKF